MAYAAYSDLLARYRKFAEDIGDSSAAMSTWITPAEREIEGRLAEKFSLPFASTPTVVKTLILDTAMVHWLASRDPERATALREMIDAQLTRITEGKEGIVLSATETIFATEGAGVVYHTQSGFKPVFDMRDSIDQHVDSDRTDAEDDADDG